MRCQTVIRWCSVEERLAVRPVLKFVLKHLERRPTLGGVGLVHEEVRLALLERRDHLA